MLVNYAFGVVISGSELTKSDSKLVMLMGVVGNLVLLGYFKYANFFIDNFNLLFGSSYNFEKIILPLAISFFTFQQIAYLVDTYRGETREYNFLHYCLFVTFFPQLIAGPIVHHREMMPQFANNKIYKFNYNDFAIGITVFILGLFKKVVIADGLAGYVSPVFSSAETVQVINFMDAWIASLAYTFQLYFDFSGYSEMALGLACMFGIRLPLNFFSPYKANNITEFWRRWHITLSRFLRDYVYISLGGNRKGSTRRYINVLLTMLLGGLWHGAGWTFVLWGLCHGLFLVAHQSWRKILSVFKFDHLQEKISYLLFARSVTFLSVVFAWVLFRAETLTGAGNILKSMIGMNGISAPRALMPILVPVNDWLSKPFFVFNGLFETSIIESGESAALLLVCLIAAVFILPNIYQLFRNGGPACKEVTFNASNAQVINLRWKASYAWGIFTSVIAAITILHLSRVSEFLYFQF